MAGFFPQLVGPALDAFTRGVRDIRERARRELNLSEDNVIIRSLRPEDLGRASTVTNAKSWQWVLTNSGTTSTDVLSGVTIADNRFCMIAGVSVDGGATGDDSLSQVSITRKGSVAREWNLEYAKAQLGRSCFFSDPITMDQNTTLTVSIYSLATATHSVAFLGAVAEKRGMVFNP